MTRTKGEQFAGVTVALITPFRHGEIDFTALRRLVDWHIEQGTDCLAPVGTTGESPTLNFDEHVKVIELTVKFAAGRCTERDARTRGGTKRPRAARPGAGCRHGRCVGPAGAQPDAQRPG